MVLQKALNYKVTMRLLNQLKDFFEKDNLDPDSLTLKKENNKNAFNFEIKKSIHENPIFDNSGRNSLHETRSENKFLSFLKL